MEEIIDVKLREFINITSFSEIWNTSGIWAIYGKDSGGKETCLEVGESSNMKNELAK